jgi:hypothetical protein
MAFVPKQVDTDLVRDAEYVAKGIHWLLKEANDDGSWGYGNDVNKMIVTEQVLKCVLAATEVTYLPEIERSATWVDGRLAIPTYKAHRFLFVPEQLALGEKLRERAQNLISDIIDRLGEENFEVSLPREKQFVDPCLWLIFVCIFHQHVAQDKLGNMKKALDGGLQYILKTHLPRDGQPKGTWDRTQQEDSLALLTLACIRYYFHDMILQLGRIDTVDKMIQATFGSLLAKLDGNEMREHFLLLDDHNAECFIVIDLAETLGYLKGTQLLNESEESLARKLLRRMVEHIERNAITGDLSQYCYWELKDDKRSFAPGNVYATANALLAVASVHERTAFSHEVLGKLVVLLRKGTVTSIIVAMRFWFQLHRTAVKRTAIVGLLFPLAVGVLSWLGVPHLDSILTNIVSDIVLMSLTFIIARRRPK